MVGVPDGMWGGVPLPTEGRIWKGGLAPPQKKTLDDCIVWNEENTVFGWKAIYAQHKMFTSCIQGNSLAKYADDTYLIVPASNNVDSRILELDNIEEWAKANTLTHKRSKSAEIVIIERRSAMTLTPSHHRCQTYAEYQLSRYLVLQSLLFFHVCQPGSTAAY